MKTKRNGTRIQWKYADFSGVISTFIHGRYIHLNVKWTTITILAFLLCAAADTLHGLRVHLVDVEQKPLAGVVVELELYEYTDKEIMIHHSGQCTTDIAGICLIEIAKLIFDASGFLRGNIVVGEHGSRPVIWPGGMLDIPVWLDVDNTLDVTGESQPYAGQAQDMDVRITRAPRLRLADVIIPLIIIGGLLSYLWINNKSHKRGNDEE
ncbi:MAG: hypothetical protein HN413_13330 [Chloroflexi bacterium]|nr:hypothetical protein [Chloroflexota bacterium]